MTQTLDRVPAHLRKYVVEQDYERYTAVDQAVWRFVLLQMYEKLQRTAHPAYAYGLRATGISVERIPALSEMDRCLSRCGWGAVGVDGFIPPRAFTEFQALGLLPICAEIRSANHLVYTPAPDIIHEAAGHAPILVDPKYASYLKRIGEVGARAFRVPEDDAVYDAIFALSEIKERPGAAQSEIQAAEVGLQQAERQVQSVSEATRVSRLYWWTAEYGLLGTPENYKLYGAGLLSSLGESHSCHAPSVKKLPLTADCVNVSYDITRAQPQLFVAEDFDQLGDVLSAVAASLAAEQGGRSALLEAARSRELCTLTLDTETSVTGLISEAVLPEGGNLMLAILHGRTALSGAGAPTEHEFGQGATEAVWVLIGDRADGSSLAGFSDSTGQLDFSQPLPLGHGLSLSGTLISSRSPGQRRAFWCEQLVLRRGDAILAEARRALVLFAGRLLGARAGAADSSYYEATGFSGERAPKPRSFPATERAMIDLYQQALAAHANSSTAQMVETFERIHQVLEREFPHDWLLRWNVLESLVKRQYRGPLTAKLKEELAMLEDHYEGKEPIASGLGYLDAVANKRFE